MAIAHVQSIEFDIGNHAPSITRSFAGTTVVGNLLVIVIKGLQSRTVSSVTGLATWSSLHATVTNTSDWVEMWAGICTSAGTDVSITLSGGDASTSEALMEFSGAADPLTEGGTSTEVNSTGVTGFTAAAVTPGSDNSVFICGGKISSGVGGWTKDADFTEVQFPDAGNQRGFAEYKIQNSNSAAEDFTASWTTARNVVAILAALQGSAGGSAYKPKRATLLGVG